MIRDIESQVFVVSVVLGKLPNEVWDGVDYEDLNGVVRAYNKLQGGDKDSGPQIEDANELDLYLMREARRQAMLA